MVDGGAYSSFIRLAKIILPVTALSLLAVLFFLARAPSGHGELPFARIEIDSTDEQLVSPVISGMSAGGDRIQLQAARIRIIDQGGQAETMALRVDGAEGGWITVEAGSARMNRAGTWLGVGDLARIDSSLGYRVETAGLEVDLTSGAMQTDGALEIRAPYGQLTAQSLHVQPSADRRAHHLVFTGGVRLIYSPQIP